MKVVAVYPDEDLALWESHLPQMPRGWIVACDSLQQINAGEAYFLPAIPNLYLLDARKQVEIAVESIAQATENLRLQTDYYQAGTCTMSDLLEAQSLYQQSRDKYVESYAGYEIKKREYLQATGR